MNHAYKTDLGELTKKTLATSEVPYGRSPFDAKDFLLLAIAERLEALVNAVETLAERADAANVIATDRRERAP